MGETQSKQVERVTEFLRASREQNRNWMHRARTARRFFCGAQWDTGDLETLRSQNRPALTINRIMPVCNVLSGTQRQNRRDLKVFPRRGGLEQVAAMFTALLKHAEDTSNAGWTKSAAFMDGVVAGKGWLAFDIDPTHDPVGGDLVVKKLNPLRVWEDRSAEEYDINRSCRYVISEEYADLDYLKARYPRKRREIAEATGDAYDDAPSAAVDETDDYQDDPESAYDQHKLRRKVRECWYKTWAREVVLYLPGTGQHVRLKPAQVPFVKELRDRDPQAYRVVEVVLPTLHLTVTCGDALLEHIDDPLHGFHDLPFVRFTPYMLDDNILGVVDNLIGPQQELNKRRSQSLHHLNISANSGWIGDEDAMSEQQWLDLEDFGSKPGVTIKKRRGAELQRITPAPLSQGHMQLEQLATNDIREISSINSDLQGLDKSNSESGRAMMFRQRQGLLASETVFDNWDQTVQLYGNMLLEIVRRGRDRRNDPIYSDDEVIAICEAEHVQNIGPEVLRAPRIGRYGVKVATASYAPSTRFAMMEMLMDLARSFPIDPTLIIEASDLPNKERIIASIQQARQAEAQAAAGEDQRKTAETQGNLAIDAGKLALEREKHQADLAAKGFELGMKNAAETRKRDDGTTKRDTDTDGGAETAAA